MDSAEEVLIAVALVGRVIGEAVYDKVRLNDSKIVHSEEWANKLRSAVKALDAKAVRYLKPALGTQPPAIGQGGAAGTEDQDEARAILREVREMINDFNTKG